jgi:NADH-quinone oxidoreductase subunit E
MGRLLQEYASEVRRAVAKFPEGRQASAAVEVLYLAQAAYGRLTPEAIREVAEALEMEPTRVRGLVGFYSLLMDGPHGGFVIHLCTDLPCALRGAEELLDVLREQLGCEVGQTSDDGLFTLHECMCLGACDRAPLMQVNLEYFYDLDPGQIPEIVADLRERAASGLPSRPPFGFGPPSDIEGGRR